MLRSAALALAWAATLAAAKADAAQELIATDRAYAALAAKEGVLAATLAYSTPETVYLGRLAAHLQGAPAVRAAWGHLPAGATMSWTVNSAQAAASGDLGYTIGAYTYRQPRAGQSDAVVRGHYCTIWKLQPDRTWRIVLDAGETDK